jgi:hypothetical protein
LGYSFIALKIHYIWTFICIFNYYLCSIVMCFHPLDTIDVFIKLDLQCFKKKIMTWYLMHKGLWTSPWIKKFVVLILHLKLSSNVLLCAYINEFMKLIELYWLWSQSILKWTKIDKSKSLWKSISSVFEIGLKLTM